MTHVTGRILLAVALTLTTVLLAGRSAERWPGGAASAGSTLGGMPLLNALVGSQGDVVLQGASNLAYYPDTHMAVLPVSGGLEVYINANGSTYRFTGPTMGRLQASSGTPVLGPAHNGGFDSDYAGISSVLPLPASGSANRLAFYHAELHCSANANYATATVGLALSGNGGLSWKRLGPVITGSGSQSPCSQFHGAGQPSAIEAAGYVWVFYTSWVTGQPDGIGVARAPISQAANPVAYEKYDGSVWTPGIGGASVNVIQRPSDADQYAANASISYNTYLQQYLAVVETNFGFNYTASPNLLSWPAPKLFLPFPGPKSSVQYGDAWFSYPTLLGVDASAVNTTGQTDYLYYSAGKWGLSPHHLVRRWASFDQPEQPPAPANLTNGQSFRTTAAQSPFVWACSGDVTITGPSGTIQLYDNDATTGLITVLRSSNEVTTVTAPWGATCRAAFPTDKDWLVSDELADMLRSGCSNGGGCARVRIVEVDSASRIVADYWRT